MNRLAIFLALGLGGCGLAGLTVWRVTDALTRRADAATQTAAATSLPVEVFTAAPRDLVEVVRIAGTLRARHEADVVADVPGRVQAILADVGTLVRKGEPLARLESTDVALGVQQAEAAVAMAEAGQQTAGRDLVGAEAVAAVGGVTDSQLVAAKARAASADAQVMQAKAALGLARERLADTTLRAPFDGVVTRRLTDVGRLVSPGAPAFTVQDQSELQLVLAVDEHTAARVLPGAAVTVTSDHVEGDLAGVVRTVAPALDAQTRKGDVVVVLPATAGLLPQGTATARLELGRTVGAVSVPARAVVERGGETFVFVVEDARANLTPVEAGVRDGDWVEARGLEAGAAVVVTGQTYLTEGATVTVREPS